MGYGVVKFSVMENKNSANENTNQTKSFGGLSPVRITLSDGKEYVWSPNNSVTLPEPLCDEAVAADARLVLISRS